MHLRGNLISHVLKFCRSDRRDGRPRAARYMPPNARRIRWGKTAASIRVVSSGNIATMRPKIEPPTTSDRESHVRRVCTLGPQDISLGAPEPFSGRYRPETRVRLGELELPIDSHQTVVKQNPFGKEFIMFSGTFV